VVWTWYEEIYVTGRKFGDADEFKRKRGRGKLNNKRRIQIADVCIDNIRVPVRLI